MTGADHSSPVIRFGIFEVNLQSGELRKSGLKLKLTGQPFQVLTILLERPGEVVPREELQKRLWPDTFVDIEHNLNAAVNRIREALDDSAENPRFVETLPRRGYRFIAPVDGAAEKRAAAQSVSANATREIESAPRIGKRWRTAAITAGSIFCVALAVGIFLVLAPAQPRIVRSTQLTNDGKHKCCLATDGSRVYFSEGDSGGMRTKYIPLTGGNPITIPTPSLDTGLGTVIRDISPDHDRLLVSHYVRGNLSSFWIVPLSGSSPRPLTNLGEQAFPGGAWSPDGQMLVYSSGSSDLFLARGDGTDPRRLATTKGRVFNPVWSPDGMSVRFVVNEQKPVATSTFFEVSAEGGEPHEVTPRWKDKAFEDFGRWTPDGEYFLFLSNRNGRSDIWAIRERQFFPGLRKRDPIQLTAGPVIYESLAFSPDGKRIFTQGVETRGELERFTPKSAQFQPFLGGISADCCTYSNDGKWIAYVTFPEGSLWRSRADGSQRQQLTWPPVQALNPHWSPDGKEIGFTALLPGKTWKTFIIPAEGGDAHQLTQNDCSELEANWSPDGIHMTFAPFLGLNQNDPSASCPLVIYTMDLRTHEISTVPGSEGLWAPRWSPDGKRIVAQASLADTLMIYEITSRKWSELVRTPGIPMEFPQWSRDGKLIYYKNGALAYSIRIEDHQTERVADLSGILTTGITDSWFAMTPDGSPLVLRDVSFHEIYALDFEAR
jgi:Tol biopolymer transport system component/DNA-binding winged helix-turn-helix (wHTH) protein